MLAQAQIEQRVVLTADLDFGELAFRYGLPATCGVILIRLDWMDPDDPGEIVAQVLAEVQPGAIVLLHDGQRETNDARPRASTLAALPAVLQQLRADGYAFTTVSQLLSA